MTMFIIYSATSATVAAALWPFSSQPGALCSASANRATGAAGSDPWAVFQAPVAVVMLGPFFLREMAVVSSCHPAPQAPA